MLRMQAFWEKISQMLALLLEMCYFCSIKFMKEE